MIFHLSGLVVSVRKPEISDLPCLEQWLACDAYLDNIGGTHNMDQAHYRQLAENMLQENANDYSSNKYYLVQDRFTGQAIGLGILCKIDWKNRHGEYSYIIASEVHRSKIAAGDLNVVMYNYFFNDLNLNKIYGYVFANNAASLRLNLFGGKLDGTLRAHKTKDGVATDVHVFSILKKEFATFVNQYGNSLLKKHIDKKLIQWQPV